MIYHQSINKVVIIGAGLVGSSIAYVSAIKSLVHELVLIDLDRNRAEGEMLDISHGLPFLGEMDIHAGDYSDVKNASVIIVTAGAARRPGETRLDLAAKNCKIGKNIADSIMEHYNGGLILVVSNPVDVLTYKFREWTGLPASSIISSGTVLDSIRFRYLLSEKFKVDVKNIHGYIIGEHGDTQFPAWSATNIAGFDIDEFCRATGIDFPEAERIEMAHQTKIAGAEIIKLKGATHYGIGVAVATLLESLISSTGTIRTVGSLLQGEYGIHDVVVSVPTIISGKGVEKVLKLDLTDKEQELLEKSAAAVRATIDHVKDI